MSVECIHDVSWDMHDVEIIKGPIFSLKDSDPFLKCGILYVARMKVSWKGGRLHHVFISSRLYTWSCLPRSCIQVSFAEYVSFLGLFCKRDLYFRLYTWSCLPRSCTQSKIMYAIGHDAYNRHHPHNRLSHTQSTQNTVYNQSSSAQTCICKPMSHTQISIHNQICRTQTPV